MNGSRKSDSAQTETRDAVAELIRAGGRRPNPPREHFDEVFGAAHDAWQAKVVSRRKTRFIVSVAASISAVACAAVLLATLLPRTAATVAVSQMVVGDVAVFSPRTGEWQPIGNAAYSIRAGDVIRTAAGSGATLGLETGASLRIAADTRLRLEGPQSFVLDVGTAYVDSGRGELPAPVTILTPFGAVREIGTQFEVHASEESLRVRVRSGRVELTRPYAETERTDAGEEISVSESGLVERRPFAASDAAWEWVMRLAIAPPNYALTIRVYLAWAANEFGRELRFDSPNTELQAEISALNTELSGFSPEEVLESIALTSGLSYRFIGDEAILISGQ